MATHAFSVLSRVNAPNHILQSFILQHHSYWFWTNWGNKTNLLEHLQPHWCNSSWKIHTPIANPPRLCNPISQNCCTTPWDGHQPSQDNSPPAHFQSMNTLYTVQWYLINRCNSLLDSCHNVRIQDKWSAVDLSQMIHALCATQVWLPIMRDFARSKQASWMHARLQCIWMTLKTDCRKHKVDEGDYCEIVP